MTRVLTDHQHRLDPATVPDDADLVVLGNPTNPTSVLHPADALRSLARPGRVLVIDEAFADAIPGEPESLAATTDVPGLVVLRSLTKTWSLPGLRAGYALGAPDLLARLVAPRPPWPIGTLTLAAVRGCCAPDAVAEAQRAATDLLSWRIAMTDALRAVPGVVVHEQARAPFLLLRVPNGPRVIADLRELKIAVRRADTFPGLGPDHLRVAVRPPSDVAVLVGALASVVEGRGAR